MILERRIRLLPLVLSLLSCPPGALAQAAPILPQDGWSAAEEPTLAGYRSFPGDSLPRGLPATPEEVRDYAAREASTPALEEFVGGTHVGLVILVLLLVTLVLVVAIVIPW